MSNNTRAAFLEALEALIEAAPDKERNAMGRAFEDYAKLYPGTMLEMQKGKGMLAGILDRIEEGCDVCIEANCLDEAKHHEYIVRTS